MGARAQGIGYASACVSDVWSMTSNVAGLAGIKTPVAAASYNTIPSFEPFNRIAAAFALPVISGGAGVSVFRFGDDLYNEHLVSIGYANKFGLASLGFKVNYLQYHAAGVATNSAVTVSFGGIATITPQLSFGAHIVNINQPVINELTGERAMTTLIAGIMLKLSETFAASGEVEKHIQHTPIVKAGMEYQAFKKICFRTGLNLNPQAGFFGLGFKLNRFDLGYAMQVSRITGVSHQATVTLPFKK